MGRLRLWQFEVKKQLSSLVFWAIIVIFTVFALSQLTGVFHFPIKSEKDIQALLESGEHAYLFERATEREQITQSLDYFKKITTDGMIPQERIAAFDGVIDMLESGKYSFDAIYDSMKNDAYVLPYLVACKAQFSQSLRTIDVINQTMRVELDNKGYTPILYQKYVTYMQIIAALIIFPLFMFLFMRDYKSGMFEVVSMQPIKAHTYILSRYFGAFIPVIGYLYILGLSLNVMSAMRFIGAGYPYRYTLFLPTFMLYVFPSIFFFSTLVTVAIMWIKKAVAVFPLYIIVVLVNATPAVFCLEEDVVNILMPLIRLDTQSGSIEQILLNRLVYLALGGVFLALTCRLYKKMKTDLTKEVTL